MRLREKIKINNKENKGKKIKERRKTVIGFCINTPPEPVIR
jgi:hypothetical protein